MLEDQDVNTPVICLCANIGASRAILSANGGHKLFSLNNEHSIPGNQFEEERALEFLTRKSGLVEMFRQNGKSTNPEIDRKEFTDFICQMKIPHTRMLGKPDQDAIQIDPAKRSKNYSTLAKMTQGLILPQPDITAMQISHEEDFMIIGSSGIFEKLQGIDILNIVW